MVHGNSEPFTLEQRIGGESLSDIYVGLLCNYKGKGELPALDVFYNKAYSIFECKRKLLLKMEELDPNGGWLSDGAQFIKTKKGGDFSLKSLNAIFDSLESEGRTSPHFLDFFLKKRNGI